MGLEDKFEDIKGKAKEEIGKATGDDQMQAEGVGEQLKASAKEAGQKIADIASKAKDAITDAFKSDK